MEPESIGKMASDTCHQSHSPSELVQKQGVLGQHEEPVVHALSVRDVPVSKEIRRVGQGQSSLRLMDFERERHATRAACLKGVRHNVFQAKGPYAESDDSRDRRSKVGY